jgi:arylsulfatase A-like enzyme
MPSRRVVTGTNNTKGRDVGENMQEHSMPERRMARSGLLLAIALGLALLGLTAWQTVATLLLRLGTTEVMRAAGENPLAGAMGLQFAQFFVAQFLLHAGFGVVAWTMALVTVSLWRTGAKQFLGVVVLWFCLLTFAVLAHNATWFPRTGSGGYYRALATTEVGPYLAGQLVSALVLAVAFATLAAAALRFLWTSILRNHRRTTAVSVAAVLATTVIAGATIRAGASSAGYGPGDKPNVILIGIDSLRLEQLRRFGGTGATPHLDAFLAQADVVSDATTPVARTFPSWLAILTGRSPRTTGAVFNLMQRGDIRVNPTLADVLRANGYRTYYATDEVRFAPIDASYGFDEVITPPIGAADFLLGNFNDLPLPTVVANSRLGRLLFPYSYGNRGAAVVFQPETYLSRIDRELEFDGPTLLALHLTAAHWPYFISSTPPLEEMRPRHDQDRPLYMGGLKTADAMFSRIIQMLEDKGALDNAIVVVLSDHGEALGLRGDNLVDPEKVQIDGALMPPSVLAFGHGQSVLSPVQYQVLVSFRSFGTAAGFVSSGRSLETVATVEDIAPTLLDLVNADPTPLRATGESLADTLRSHAGAPPESAARFRYTETDLRVMADVGGTVDEDQTARENSMYFKVDVPTGRLHMRPEAVHLLMNFKERAVFDRHFILACLPATPDTHQYLLLDRKTGSGRVLPDVPLADDVTAYELWQALEAGFPGELKPPTVLRPEQIQATRQAWNSFLMAHLTAARAKLESSASSGEL